jgi:hypothetical protein
MPCERELVEQRSLFDLPMSNHDLQSCRFNRLLFLPRRNRRLFKSIGTDATCGKVGHSSLRGE